jgi:O-antigen/teichoic acid export membrane protein
MMTLATLAGLIVWSSADWISGCFSKVGPAEREVMARALKLSGLAVWARLLQQVLIGLEQAYQRYGVLNIINTLQQAFSGPGLLLIAVSGGRIVAFMQWQVVVSMATLLAHGIAVRRLLRGTGVRPCWDAARTREILHYSLMAWISLLGSVLFSQCDRLLVGAILGPAPLGVYAAITGVTVQINTLSALSVQPLIPLLSEARARGQVRGAALLKQIRQALELNAAIALGLGLGLILLAPWALKILLPPPVRQEQLLTFQIAVLVYSLYSVNGAGNYLLYGLQLMKACLSVQFCSGFVTLGLIGLGAKLGGLPGAVLGGSGYLGVWLLTVIAMRHLQIPAREWLGWIAFYLICFALVVAVGSLLPEALVVRAGFAGAAGALVSGVFLRRHYKDQLAFFAKA